MIKLMAPAVADRGPVRLAGVVVHIHATRPWQDQDVTSSPGGPALRPTPLYRATALLAVCALTVGAAGCGLRIGDAAPQTLPMIIYGVTMSLSIPKI